MKYLLGMILSLSINIFAAEITIPFSPIPDSEEVVIPFSPIPEDEAVVQFSPIPFYDTICIPEHGGKSRSFEVRLYRNITVTEIEEQIAEQACGSEDPHSVIVEILECGRNRSINWKRQLRDYKVSSRGINDFGDNELRDFNYLRNLLNEVSTNNNSGPRKLLANISKNHAFYRTGYQK